MSAQAQPGSKPIVNDAVAAHVANVEACKVIITQKLGALKPKVAIIIGSGLGGLADKIDSPVKIAYRDLPGFPILTVVGHSGELIAGKLGGVDVIAFKGRKHFYETDDPYPLKTMIRAAKAVGVETLFVSNAAGALRPDMNVSELMAIADHINDIGLISLPSANDEASGPRVVLVATSWCTVLLVVVCVVCVLMTLALLTFTLVVVFWEHRVVVLVLLLLLYAGGAGAAFWTLRNRLRDWQAFAATLDQIKKDRACLEKPN